LCFPTSSFPDSKRLLNYSSDENVLILFMLF
jgi:hypothetical protein